MVRTSKTHSLNPQGELSEAIDHYDKIMADLTTQKVVIPAQDGYKISVILSFATGEHKGTIILSSAACVKKEFYIKFARFLNEHHYHVVLFDYRGIGESSPPNLKESKIFMHEWGTKDMNAVLDYTITVFGRKNIIWLGHSIGAQLVGFLENAKEIKKVISINAALGYWRYFPFPMNLVVWSLWYIVCPLMIRFYGYGVMKKIGWGENLPKYALLEWRRWCTNKHYYKELLQRKLQTDRFHNFAQPITAIYTSDDFIANDKSVPLMMRFFPNAPVQILKLSVQKHTKHKVGHTGIFRKKFEKSLWPLLVELIER